MDDVHMSRQEMIEKFSELEDKYKIESSPEGIQNILGIYDITQTSDLIPVKIFDKYRDCLLYTSPSPRDATLSRMPSSA